MAIADAQAVQRTPNDVIADTGQVFDAPPADQHDRVLLQVVSDARNIGGDLNAVGQAHAGNLTQVIGFRNLVI